MMLSPQLALCVTWTMVQPILIAAMPVQESKNELTGVISLDELMGGFRVQQLTLSNTMLNTSRRLGLADKLAKAEVQEAEERQAKAFRAANEARTPFIATTSRYNLGYIGRGYDVYYGNPLSDDGQVDPGFRLPVIELPFSFRFTSDGEYRIPDNVDVIAEASASFGSSFHSVKTLSDYQKMLKVDASVNLQGGGYGLSASFSASTSYEKSSREIEKGESTALNLIGKAIVYKARFASTAGISKVSDFFESAVLALPTRNCETEAVQNAYLDVIKEFGTHYTTEVVMGAKAVQELKFKQSDLDKLSSEGISVKVAAQASYSGFGVSGGGGFSAGVSSSESARNSVNKVSKEKREYYIGGNPPSGSYNNGDTESLREWARSASEKPAPIQYKLSSIESIIRPEYFKRLDRGFYNLQDCFRRALIAHCSTSVNPGACRSGEAERGLNRRKRSADNEDEPSTETVKFGDLIKLSNNDAYLALSKSRGFAPGTVTKLLTSVSSITNYDGIFRVAPLEDEANKVGSELLNGEPFLLQTVGGEKLYAGRVIIPNVDKSTKLQQMQIETNADEKKLLNQDADEDFSVFLKDDKLRFYMIRLKVNAFYSTKTFQLTINGDKGLIRLQFVRSRATSNSYLYKTLAESDVGKLQKAHIMDTGAYYVTEIFVYSVVNGKKESAYKSSFRCGAFVNEIPLGGNAYHDVDIDVYPVQFSFNGKGSVQGSPVNSRSVGFLEVLSSIPKKKFWGRPESHLISVANSKVNIIAQGPPDHSALSSGCDVTIYPDNDVVSKRYTSAEGIVIAFQIRMMINSVQVYKENTANDFSFSYLDNDETFTKLRDNEVKMYRESNTLIIWPEQRNLYATSVRIHSPTADMSKIKMVVKGCPSGIIVSENKDSMKQEWKIDISQNEVTSYPHLTVNPKENNRTDIRDIIATLDRPVPGSTTISVPLSDNQRSCVFSETFFVDFLGAARETGNLRINDITLRTKQQRGTTELELNLKFQALNRDDYDIAMMYLGGTLTTAVRLFPCGIQESFTLAARQSGDSISGFTVAGIVGGVLGVAVLLVLLLAGYIWFRMKNKDTIRKIEKEKNPLMRRHETKHDDQDEDDYQEDYENVGYNKGTNRLTGNFYSTSQSAQGRQDEFAVPPRQKRN